MTDSAAIRSAGRTLIEQHVETLEAAGSPDAQVLRDYLAEMQRLAFEASFLRMQQRQDDNAESDRLSLRFGQDFA
ncbi:hypothetical protein PAPPERLAPAPP_01730 [Brevundimonas phage vB_BpoS-Papperlapapp]|uniref:Uncharacterized protein n=2 Tax=Marchewkavirus TaxID=3425052 RepID=A0A9E7MPP8_9CAUD|nr:hypothetical protein KABACHOK_00100 [Brevundimonas phage vB_BpoS-Kabachok]USN14544.1 hypothetical protein DOMOVOI_00690 [Brevundimonas phage vB_BpoS-Domovoi]USN15915.1 hypothetical protein PAPPERLAPAPP_01730 [Brevundimonas phage vB_BpoS-Papperlapapp]